LSPTADIFTPKGLNKGNASAANTYGRALTPAYPLGAGSLVPNSVPDYSSNVNPAPGQGNSPPGIIGQPSTVAINLTAAFGNTTLVDFESIEVAEGLFSFDEKAARVLAVENCVSDLALPSIVRILSVS
jgi:hypothetical protein